MRIGIIGCGAIGTEISKAIDKDDQMSLSLLIDRHRERVDRVCGLLRRKPRGVGYSVQDFDRLLDSIDVDLVVECASQQAVREYVVKAIEKGKDVMIMSVGALSDDKFLKELEEFCRRKKSMIYIPSGAIVGIDGLKSAMIGSIKSVRLTTRKPPSSFRNNEFVTERKIDVDGITKETILFEGDAREAVKFFPENINVAASLSIAGIGFEKTKVRVIADPSVNENIHEIEVDGDFGCFYTKVKNVPSPSNPKTSYLASLSAIATLKNIARSIRVGT